MRLLLFLFILAPTICFSQKTVKVKTIKGEPIADVSVYQLSKNNTLLGITDSIGIVNIAINENQKYLFHLLGYEDITLTTDDLKKSSTVKLNTSSIALNEVVVKKLKTKLIKIVNKPGNWSIGEQNTVKTIFERVTVINIEKPGFLYKFSLFAHQNFTGEYRVFRFILFNANNGSPSNSLLNANIIGTLKKGKMTFNLDSIGVYLRKGNYFIGYETVYSGKPNKIFKTLKTNKGIYLEYPTIFIKGKNVSTPKAFYRSNLKDWYNGKNDSLIEKDKSLIYRDIAYELEMRIPIVN